MKILMVLLPERGHLHPLLGPARRLEERGCEVSLYASHDVSSSLQRAGFTRFAGGDSGLPPPPDANRGAAFAELVRDRERLRAWIRGLLLRSLDEEPVERLRRVVRRLRPEALVIDPMAWSAVVVAEQEGIPWVGLSSSLNPAVPDRPELRSTELARTLDDLAPARSERLARWGVRADFRLADALSPRLTVVFATEELVGPAPPGVELVGPSRFPGASRGDETPLPLDEPGDPRPLVYLSFGSQVYHQPALFHAVFEAARHRPLRLLASVGELAASALLDPLPANVTLTRYAPQLAVLARARAMITHGGANSIMEALDAGVPLLVSPICNDAFHNAELVAASGAGLRLDLATTSTGSIGAALDALLADGPLRRAAARIGAAYQSRDGATRAAELILERCR